MDVFVNKFLMGILMIINTIFNGGGNINNSETPMIKLVEDTESENTIIGEQPIESYILNVLCKEMSPYIFSKEALKAQAVLIRTYAITENKRHPDNAKCLTTHCQAYMKDLSSFNEDKLNIAKEAIDETKGEVLFHNNEMVKNPVYFAYGYKYTNDSEDVWNNYVPYLRSVETYEDKPPETIIMSLEEFLDRLNLSSYDHFTILDRNTNGYIMRVLLYDEVLSGTDFRNLLSLKSTNLDVSLVNDKVHIKVYGYGHGVGMSQYGADVMSREGKTYKEILHHYYKDIDIVSHYGM